ncbi:hypothetical protein SAMN05519105_2256 [Rhodobacter sp. 24-YEA-8]|nr:hypothetical protein SAMN05519105_2256 [Rhodobacter sp. 24-YEA-8]
MPPVAHSAQGKGHMGQITVEVIRLPGSVPSANQQRSKHSTIYATKIVEAGHLKAEAEVAVLNAENQHVMCPMCRVPINEIKAKGCGISVNPCNMEEIEKQNAKKIVEAKELEKQANISSQEVKAINAKIDQLDDVIRSLTKQIRAASKIATDNAEMAREIQEGVLEKRMLLDTARKLSKKRSDITNSGVAQNRLDEEREKMRSGRQRSLPKIGQISDVYRGILSTCFPGGMDGSIELDGNGLKVDAYFSGRSDVSTAALESLKIVAFDLSAMHRASEGKTDLPAFLLHDSPREADLDSALYAAIFTLAAEWEFGSGVCSFQYIVTTTTAPPERLQGDEFVKLKMSSTPPNDRLFRTDL